MTGTPTVNSTLTILYKLLTFACIAGFAAYDLKKRQVPDRALLLFLPVALAAPLIHAGLYGTAFLPLFFLFSFTGAATGFLILLSAALMSKEGAGIGGGDIKLAGIMGFIYGPSRMLAVLLIASGLAACISLAARRNKGMLSLPFVPFLMVGSLAVTITTIL